MTCDFDFAHRYIQCESKKSSIFTQAKYFSVKFCQFVASIYIHTYLPIWLIYLNI